MSVPLAANRSDPQAEARIVRVFVAAHVRLYREALVDVLGRTGGLEIVGASGDRQEILAGITEFAPDVVLLDPAATDRLELIREFVSHAPNAKVVALASSDAEHDVVAYAEAGVSGFVTAEESVVDLVATILSTAQGDFVCSPQAAGALLRRVTALASDRRADSAGEPLTRRETEVAALLDEGLLNKQIALRLHLGVPTVKHHVHHILHKLGVSSRSEATARLRQSGLLGVRQHA